MAAEPVCIKRIQNKTMKLGTSFECLPFKNAPQIKRIIYALSRIISVFHRLNRGTQPEYSSRPLGRSIVKRILVFKR